MSEPTLLQTVAANLSAFVTNLLISAFGTRMGQPVLGEATWGDLLTSAILLALVLLIGFIARGWLKRQKAKTVSAPVSAEDPNWRFQLIRAVGKPLVGLFWLYGIYIALLPVLVRARYLEDGAALRQGVDRLLDLGLFAIMVWLFYRLTHLLNLQLLVWAKRSKAKIDDLLVPPLMKTVRVAVPILAVILGLPVLDLPVEYDNVVSKLSSLALIGVVAWVLFQAVRVGESVLLAAYDVKTIDNLEARKIHTQVRVLSKSLYFVIILFTLASMLMVFEEVRRFGTNILASAGVVGIILGFAAQRTIANLFAGFQLAMAQPIRLDDVLVVEGEWGRVEEITLTYVVMKIWDERRLILPLSYFIEKPFQNWTRTNSDILGSVFIWTDFTVPVDLIRSEAKRLVESNPNWDKKFWNVQVTDVTDRAVQVRVLMTASNSGNAFNMRCDVREGLIAFLQKNYPGSLPKVRTEIGNADQLKFGMRESPENTSNESPTIDRR